MRATVAGKTDMCSPRNRQHIGVPLINEDRPQYRRDEWEIPPKAAYLEGAQPKSEPTVPAPMEEPIEISSDFSDMSVDPSQSLQATAVKAFARVRSAEFQAVLSSMRLGGERELWIAQAIDDAAAAVAATAEFRLVVDRLQAVQEHRVQQGQQTLSFVDQMAEYVLQAEPDPKTGAPIPSTLLAAAPPIRPLSPPLKAPPGKRPPTPPKPPMFKTQTPLKPPPLPPPLPSPSPPPEPETGPGLSSGPEMEPDDSSSSTSTETSESEWWNPRTMEHRNFGDAVDEGAQNGP